MKFLHMQLNKQPGFTLIELLVVIVLLAIVSGVVGNLLIISLRSEQKASTASLLQQTGNNIISQFSDSVRTAYKFAGVSSDGYTYTTSCLQSGTYHFLRLIPAQSSSSAVFSCDVNSIGYNQGLLYDPSKIAVTSCTFSCFQAPGGSPTLGISFSLSKVTTSNLSENTVSAQFSAIQTMRNDGR